MMLMIHATNNCIFVFRADEHEDKGLIIAKNLQRRGGGLFSMTVTSMVLIFNDAYLFKLMHMMMFEDKKIPKTRKNAITRHNKSPPIHLSKVSMVHI